MLLAGLSLTACHRDNQTANPALPAFEEIAAIYGNEHRTPAPFAWSDTPGVTVKADFTKYHKAGEPYGNWVMEATWRSASRQVVCPDGDLSVNETWEIYNSKGCAWAVVPVNIDAATGQGKAHLPSEFLDVVFKTAHDRYQPYGANSVWHRSPGLFVNYYPADGETWEYYQFD